jgi:hypothetical protein
VLGFPGLQDVDGVGFGLDVDDGVVVRAEEDEVRVGVAVAGVDRVPAPRAGGGPGDDVGGLADAEVEGPAAGGVGAESGGAGPQQELVAAGDFQSYPS